MLCAHADIRLLVKHALVYTKAWVALAPVPEPVRSPTIQGEHARSEETS